MCYNSLGSCACSKGYAGADCSSCAAGYKRVNDYCVAAVVLAPPRLCPGGVCSASELSLALIPPPRSMAEGQIAVTVVVGGCMALVALAAVVVHKQRRQFLELKDRKAMDIKALEGAD